MSAATHFIVATAGHVDHGKERVDQGVDRHGSGSPSRGEGARHHNRPRLCSAGAAIAYVRIPSLSGDRRRSWSRGLREEHGCRRRLHRSGAARRRCRRRMDAPNGRTPADPHVLRGAACGSGVGQSGPCPGRERRRVQKSVCDCKTAHSRRRQSCRRQSSAGEGSMR